MGDSDLGLTDAPWTHAEQLSARQAATQYSRLHKVGAESSST